MTHLMVLVLLALVELDTQSDRSLVAYCVAIFQNCETPDPVAVQLSEFCISIYLSAYARDNLIG